PERAHRRDRVRHAKITTLHRRTLSRPERHTVASLPVRTRTGGFDRDHRYLERDAYRLWSRRYTRGVHCDRTDVRARSEAGDLRRSREAAQRLATRRTDVQPRRNTGRVPVERARSLVAPRDGLTRRICRNEGSDPRA